MRISDWSSDGCSSDLLLTPNVPEAEALTGLAIADFDGMRHAAGMLLTFGAPAVLLKGGHLPGGEVRDLPATPDGVVELSAPHIGTTKTHGTVCALALAMAVAPAQGAPPVRSGGRTDKHTHNIQYIM